MAIGGNANASKRKFAVAGVVLLVLAVLVALFAGGTFAKYVTEDDGSDTARVAKWGVEVEVANGEMFEWSYAKDDTGGFDGLASWPTVNDEAGGNPASVYVEGKESVVAPGTDGSFGGGSFDAPDPLVSITGTPEVAVKVNSGVTVELDEQIWGEGNEFYCPMVFTVWTEGLDDNKKQIVCGLGYDQSRGDLAQFESDLAEAIREAIDAEYAAGTELDDIKVYCTWEWPFDSSKHPDEHSVDAKYDSILDKDTSGHDGNQQSDVEDTELANKTVDNYLSDGSSPIKIKVTTTVTQID